jgi:hypothetical protein
VQDGDVQACVCGCGTGGAGVDVALAAAVPGREPDLQASADAGKHGKETAASQGHRHKWSTHDEGRRIGREEASGARVMQRTGGGREGRTQARSLVRCTRGGEPEGEMAKRSSGYSAANSEGAVAQRQGGQGRSNVAQVRRAAQDRRRW